MIAKLIFKMDCGVLTDHAQRWPKKPAGTGLPDFQHRPGRPADRDMILPAGRPAEPFSGHRPYRPNSVDRQRQLANSRYLAGESRLKPLNIGRTHKISHLDTFSELFL